MLLNLGDHEFSITDRFTLIRGKFEKEDLKLLQDDNTFENLRGFDFFYLGDFINIIQSQEIEFRNIDNSLKLIEYLEHYQIIASFNLSVLDKFIILLNSLNLIVSYSLLLGEKDLLKKKLDLIKFIKNSEEYIEVHDELINLELVLRNDRKKIKFLNEDHIYLKNQRDKIKNEISNYNLNINSLNEKIKESKKKINGIINGMNGELDLEKEEMSKSERILTLQRKIRDFKHKIKQNLSHLDEIQLQMDKVTPKLEILKKDYNSLLNTINKTTNEIRKHKSDLMIKLFDEIDDRLIELEWLNTPDDINENLKVVDNKLKRISASVNLDQLDLSNIIVELKKIEELILTKQDELEISYPHHERIEEAINSFREIENLFSNLENILNKFLIQINIKCSFDIIINEENTRFKIHLNFIRPKDIVNFTELTTPKKIFFVIIFYLSIKILLKNYNIIFSNILLPDTYNKSGSVYRTIKKVLPVFEADNELKDFNLIFIISNLEMKKPIENIKIININE